ncbi:hypothetical protein CHUAL_000889 [Chamberlinius hualienensis]
MASNGEVVKRKLYDLRVVDLKAELENRNLDKTGVKVVLQERLQQALESEGHNCEDYLFEVTESPVVKKPTKRTNKKLTRDDESETHSNIDESQNDITLEDDEKLDSDEDRIDEKFFQVLETTEDTINLSIEDEEEKLLTEEDVGSECEKRVDSDGYAENGNSEVEQNRTDSRSRLSPKRESQKCQVNSFNNTTSEQEYEVSSGESRTEASSTKESNSKAIEHGKSLQQGNNSHNSESLPPGAKTDEGGNNKGGSAGSNVSSSTASKHSLSGGGSDGKENGSSETTQPSVASSNSVTATKQDETAIGSATAQAVATSPNKAKSTVAKDGNKTSERTKVTRPLASGKNLWVTGLSSATRATDLKALFSKHGKVLGAKVVSNARSSVSRCYGFITMATAEEAVKCIQHLHRTELHGRMISVEKAKTDPIGSGRKVAARPAAIVMTKKSAVKKDATSFVKGTGDVQEKKTEDSDKKEKKSKEDDSFKEISNQDKKESVDESVQVKENVVAAEIQQDEKISKKVDEKRDSSRRSTRDSRERKTSERREHQRELPNHRRSGINYIRDKLPRRPFIRRPMNYRPLRRNTLTFERIRAERLRQRAKEQERELRDSERRRRMDIARRREIDRKQREEAIRIERERERLRIEREKLERERAEVLRLEREKQKLERERIEREREELRRRERMSRMDEHRRPLKRAYDTFRGSRDIDYDDRKRSGPSSGPSVTRRIESFERRNDHRIESVRGGIERRDSSSFHDHTSRGNDGRGERFERGPITRDTDLRGHGREDRSVSYRDGSDNIGGQSRQVNKEDWKSSNGRGRGHRDSGKGLAGSGYGADGGRSGDSRYGDRSSDTWHGNSSQSESRSGGGSKPYTGSGSGGGWGGSDRKNDSQWGSRNDSWSGGGSGCGGGIGSGRSQQSMGMSQSIMGQSQSLFESSSGSGGGSGMIGIGMSGGGSYNSDRFESYKGMNNMRRY